MHDARHPMRQTLTRVEDLFVDIHTEVKLSELSAELMQTVRLMAARKSNDPAFWLHAFKFLNDFKDDIYTRLWTGKDEADHQTRLVLAQRCATIQIRLLIRDKHLPPALQSALTHMFGPALALLMLRRSHDRHSRTLINAMQLVYESIETHQDSPISSSPYNRPAEKDLAQRLRDFFKGITGIMQALTPQALAQLQSGDNFFLSVLESGDSQVIAPISVDATEPSQAKVVDLLPIAKAPTRSLDNEQNAEHETPARTNMNGSNNMALNALLERMILEHRFTWFQVQVCENSPLYRLMLGSYKPENQSVILLNVRHEPILTLSVADFDAGLKAGLTRPLNNDLALKQLLLNYLRPGKALANVV